MIVKCTLCLATIVVSSANSGRGWPVAESNAMKTQLDGSGGEACHTPHVTSKWCSTLSASTGHPPQAPEIGQAPGERIRRRWASRRWTHWTDHRQVVSPFQRFLRSFHSVLSGPPQSVGLSHPSSATLPACNWAQMVFFPNQACSGTALVRHSVLASWQTQRCPSSGNSA